MNDLRLPHEQSLWPVVGDSKIFQEMWVTRGHYRDTHGLSRIAVIGMESVLLPWIMRENNIWFDNPNQPNNLSLEFARVLKFPVNMPQKVNPICSRNST
jgi:hypothetical protein